MGKWFTLEKTLENGHGPKAGGRVPRTAPGGDRTVGQQMPPAERPGNGQSRNVRATAVLIFLHNLASTEGHRTWRRQRDEPPPPPPLPTPHPTPPPPPPPPNHSSPAGREAGGWGPGQGPAHLPGKREAILFARLRATTAGTNGSIPPRGRPPGLWLGGCRPTTAPGRLLSQHDPGQLRVASFCRSAPKAPPKQ